MKTVHVVAAVIRDGNRVFATQRGYGEYKDGWEFPGGKVEAGESPQEALRREIREELAAVDWEYPQFHLSMRCFWCEILEGTPVLKEHEAARWLDAESLDSVAWLPADRSVIERIRAQLRG